MSLLPVFIQEQTKKKEFIPLSEPVEYEIDFNTGQLTGRKVTGKEAVKAWIWLCVKTERFRFGIYSWNYGTELEKYKGKTLSQEYLEADCKTKVEEALKINHYIKGIKDFELTRKDETVTLNFTVITSLGEVDISV